jgi:alkylation response protein AidB-like acyl-CoA dehydrogenase
VQRTLFEPEHDLFRQSVRRFVERSITPHHAEWERAGRVPRELWLEAGALGFLGMAIPEADGGPGVPDFRFSVVLIEELARAGATGPAFTLHNDVVLPYLLQLATPEQRRRWLPGVLTGERILAIAMSEPGTGSDLGGIRTTAVRKGDAYVLDGAKTFITNGQLNDLCVVVARTDPDAGHRGISLLVVERDMPGYQRGRVLDKVGMKAQDTSELFFDAVEVPADNLLGEEGAGFVHLMQNLPQERLVIAVGGLATAEAVFGATLAYCKDRTAFGTPIASFQNTRFKLAEMRTEIEVARAFVDRCIVAHLDGALTSEEAAMAKLWVTEMQLRTIDTCVQLHGGYGYMLEYPVARAFVDSRAQTIYGGTNEIMREIVGRSLGC